MKKPFAESGCSRKSRSGLRNDIPVPDKGIIKEKGKSPVIIGGEICKDKPAENPNLIPAGGLTDSCKTAMLEEFKTLRQEILNHQQGHQPIITTAVGLAGLFGALFLENPNNPIEPLTKTCILSSIAVLLFSFIKAQVSRRKKMYRIGRYIQFRIEPHFEGLNWESAWCREHDRKGSEVPSLVENLPLLLFQLIAIISSLYYLYKTLMTFSFDETIKVHFFVLFAFIAVSSFIYEIDLTQKAEHLDDYKKEFMPKQKMDNAENRMDKGDE